MGAPTTHGPSNSRSTGPRGHAGGGRDIFPLGRVTTSTHPKLSGRVRHAVNDCVSSLNYMALGPRWTEPVVPRNEMQAAVVDRVARLTSEWALDAGSPKCQEALNTVLRGRGLYDGSSAAANLASFSMSRLSLPDSVADCPPLVQLLPEELRPLLKDGCSSMLLPRDEFVREIAAKPMVQPYVDPVLAHDSKRYLSFVKSVLKRELISFTRHCKELAGVFFCI